MTSSFKSAPRRCVGAFRRAGARRRQRRRRRDPRPARCRPRRCRGDVLLSASLAPAQSLTKATGSRTTIAQTSSMAEVMRASRTVENEIIIAPAHVTASAILHAYQLLATSGQEQSYALVVRNDIDKVEKLAGKRLYLPQQDSLRSYVAKGLLTESGVKLAPVLEGHVRQHQRRRPGRPLVRHGRRHRRRRGAGQGMDRRSIPARRAS